MAENAGWQSGESVRRYQRTADVVIPYRQEILAVIARLGAAFTPDRPRVLDLGCGMGDVTAEILKLKPDASAVLIDNSEEMLKIARERYKDNGSIRIISHDLNGGLPLELAETEFDLCVSCFATHHIDYAKRKGLYAGVRGVLVKTGLFINGDRFTGESPAFSGWEHDDWMAWTVDNIREKLGIERTLEEVKRTQAETDEKHGDKPETIWSMRADMLKAGFRHVDCVWKSYNLGVLAAAKDDIIESL